MRIKITYSFNFSLDKESEERLIPLAIAFMASIKKYNFNIDLNEIPALSVKGSDYLEEILQTKISQLPEDFFQAWDKLNDEGYHLGISFNDWAVKRSIIKIVARWSPYIFE